jgi:hypothetical protein
VKHSEPAGTSAEYAQSGEARVIPWLRFLAAAQPGSRGPRKAGSMIDRMTWPQICHCHEYRGQWVAMDHCRYDENTMQPIEGDVVDSDSDLGDLCSRMREAGRSSCAIRFCDSEEATERPTEVHSAAR